MKNLLLLLLYLMSINVFSQKDIPQSSANIPKEEGQRNKITSFLAKKIYDELKTYCEPQEKNPNYIKFSGTEFFKQRFKEIFSTVVTTNSDVVENGSAFSYVKDKDANTLSINGAHFIERAKLIVDVGVSTKMQSDSYKFYAEGSWSNDITGSMGISIRTHFTNKAENYEDYISQCDSVNQIRWQFVNDTLLPKYNKLNKWAYDPELLKKTWPNELKRKKGAVEEKGKTPSIDEEFKDDLFNTYVAASIRIREIDSLIMKKFDFTEQATYPPSSIGKTTVTDKTKKQNNNITTGTITVDDVKTANIVIDTNNGEKVTLTEFKALDLKKELADLIEIRNTAIELLRLRDNKDSLCNPVKSYIDAKFSKFDAKHDISVGYSISWLTFKTYLTNSSINISNQNIIDESIQEKIDNLFKLSIEASWNFNYNKTGFVYGKVFTKFNRGSLLDSQVLKTDGFNVFAETTTIPTFYTIQNDNGVTISNYNELKHPVYNMDLGLYGAYLFDKKKSIGISGQASINFPFESVQIEYKPTYTLLLGLLVKAKADAVIVNLSSGFENQYYSTNAWDNFIVKASVGVPFTIFEKKAAK